MNDNQKKVIGHVLMQIHEKEVVKEELLKNYVDIFSQLNPLTDEEKQEVIIHLHATLLIRMSPGGYIKEENHKSWFYASKPNLDMTFWERYRLYLQKEEGFNSSVVDSLDKATDEMLDLLGNPKNTFSFQRRGLVIGDVQSGKTATYTALINKAADAGYRVIILLTGVIEKLRKQTQARIDRGFVGLDSSALIRDRDNIHIGVGIINPSIQGFVLTSTSSDFNKATANKLNCKLSSIQDPVLFVLKKNKSVLEKLEQWLRVYNAVDGKISSPLLLIDDEADNASVNTHNEDENPTAINAAIRRLLSLFVKANYVGYTATPFANIFINPDSNQEMLEDDLFPKDFIYALEAPSNYVGARGVFEDDGPYSYMLKSNDDCESYIPEKHKIDFIPSVLPDSLREAVASFFIANVIRDLRGQQRKHRSMLINISRFIAVQKHIEKAIDAFVREMQREIKNYYLLEDEASIYDTFSLIHNVYEKYYSETEFSWNIIQKSLHSAASPIVVRTVSGGNASKNLNYDECEDDGLRIIAIGGYSLSRGLTLEGLCISYFYRNSKMYDTLMQMGRWFGYREGYIDLCQIWMSEENIAWYKYISFATDELRREVYRMQDAKKTPRDFGLCVRSDINVLLVTARNKMRFARDYSMLVSLNGEVIETQFLHSDLKPIEENFLMIKEFINRLLSGSFKIQSNQNSNLAIDNLQILNVPKQEIIELLKNFKSHYLNFKFRTDDLVNLIDNYGDDTLDSWDVVFGKGQGNEIEFCNLRINTVERSFRYRSESKALQMSGSSSHLGSKTEVKAGLTKEQVHDIENRYKEENLRRGIDRSPSQETYFRSGIRRNPLLIIYPIQLKYIIKNEMGELQVDVNKKEITEQLGSSVVFGLSIGIPTIDGREKKTYLFKINMVKYRELLEIDGDYEEDFGV